MTRLFSPKTNLIYDNRVGDASDANLVCLPTPAEIGCNFPSPTGWCTGMEDSVLNGGAFLLAAMRRHDATGDEESLKVARLLLDGLCRCAENVKTPGFLARSLSPDDGKSHYLNSSRDQYTLFAYALWRYHGWRRARAEEKSRIGRLLVGCARYAERCMTPESDFTLLREDGGPAKVSQMWTARPGVDLDPTDTIARYGGISPHEALRLPQLYAAAYAVSGDAHWRTKELEVTDAGIEMSFGRMPRVANGHALLQMQLSVRQLWELEADGGRKDRYLKLMNRVADLSQGTFERARATCEKIGFDFTASAIDWRTCLMRYEGYARWEEGTPEPVGDFRYFVPVRPESFVAAHKALRETAESQLVLQLCPGRAVPAERTEHFEKVFSGIDYTRLHVSVGPVHAVLVHWLARNPLT